VRRRSRRAVAAVAATGALIIAGCGSDTSSTSDAVSTTTAAVANGLPAYDAEQQLPPNDIGSLRRLYDPVLEPLGVRLTRGALIDISNDQYVPSNDGRHLALYVEPIGDYTTEQYVEGFWSISALVTPDVFARWPQLESYDICQEPLPSVDDDPEPFPITQINLTREAAATVDWEGGDLVDLLLVSRTNPDVKVVVNRELRQSAPYMAADAAARTKAGLPPQSSTTTTGSD
jgi:hypothetical protein